MADYSDPNDKFLDELEALLGETGTRYAELARPEAAGWYDNMLRALKATRVRVQVLQEELLALEEPDENEDDDSVESQVIQFIESLGYKRP